jgi:DNA-directed RNA polymerase subunit F
MQKRIIRYKVPKPILDKALELFFKENPQATTNPEISELYEGKYIQRARAILSNERRHINEQFLKNLQQEAFYYKQLAELNAEHAQELNQKIEELKQQYEQKIQQLQNENNKLKMTIIEKQNEIVYLQQQTTNKTIPKKNKRSIMKYALTGLGITLCPIATIPLAVLGASNFFKSLAQTPAPIAYTNEAPKRKRQKRKIAKKQTTKQQTAKNVKPEKTNFVKTNFTLFDY